MRPLLKLSNGPLRKSGLGPLASNAPTRRPYVGYLNRCTFHLAKIGMTWRGSLFGSDPNKCREAKMRPLFELFSDHY